MFVKGGQKDLAEHYPTMPPFHDQDKFFTHFVLKAVQARGVVFKSNKRQRKA